MTGTPGSFAVTPDRPLRGPPDLLSEMLKAVRLTGSVFLDARFTAPFGVITPRYFDPGSPLAHLRHVSILHLIVEGSCTIETADGTRREVEAGDILFLPLADKHKFWHGEPTAIVSSSGLTQPGPIEGMWTVNYGGGGETLRMVCGFLESAEFMSVPLFRTLPQLVVEHTGEDNVGRLIASTVGEILALVDQPAPGTQAVLGRLMELLFVEVLRRHIARLSDGSGGWFAALNDPVVGRVLQLLHADPARRWTIEELARAVGSSRTVVADRFKARLGRPPIDYATGWRIQLAAERLRAGHESLSGIAADIGYESEAAFIRAFKRITGLTPGAWRDQAAGTGGLGFEPR